MDFKIVATLCSLLAIIGNYAVTDAIPGTDCNPDGVKCCILAVDVSEGVVSETDACDAAKVGIVTDGTCSMSRDWEGGDALFEEIGSTVAGAYDKCVQLFIKHKEKEAEIEAKKAMTKGECYKKLVDSCTNPEYSKPVAPTTSTSPTEEEFFSALADKMCYPKSTSYQTLVEECEKDNAQYPTPAYPTPRTSDTDRPVLEALANDFCKPKTKEDSYKFLIDKCREEDPDNYVYPVNPTDTLTLLVQKFCKPHILKDKSSCAKYLVDTCKSTDNLYEYPLNGLTGTALSGKLDEIAQNVCKPPIEQMYEICQKDHPDSTLKNPFKNPGPADQTAKKTLVSDNNKAFCKPKVATDKSSVEFLIQACTERKTEFPNFEDPRVGLTEIEKDSLYGAYAKGYCNQTADPDHHTNVCVYTRTGSVQTLIDKCKGDPKYKNDYQDPLKGLKGTEITKKLNKLAENYCNQTAGGSCGGAVPTPCPTGAGGGGGAGGGAGKTYIGLSSLWMFFTILNQ